MKKRWGLFIVKHVIPMDDLVEHEMGMSCWCNPRVEEPGETGYIVIHNAADQREDYEEVSNETMG